MTSRRAWLLLLLAAAMLLVTLGCLKQERAPASATREFNLTAKRYTYTPDNITVKAGTKVVVHLTSTDVTHGFAIDAFHVNTQILPGKSTTIEFVADKPGTYTYYCTVFCGSGHPNHKGTLVVTA